jgi:hypothetical protein
VSSRRAAKARPRFLSGSPTCDFSVSCAESMLVRHVVQQMSLCASGKKRRLMAAIAEFFR